MLFLMTISFVQVLGRCEWGWQFNNLGQFIWKINKYYFRVRIYCVIFFIGCRLGQVVSNIFCRLQHIHFIQKNKKRNINLFFSNYYSIFRGSSTLYYVIVCYLSLIVCLDFSYKMQYKQVVKSLNIYRQTLYFVLSCVIFIIFKNVFTFIVMN